jgi:hypothetical protein
MALWAATDSGFFPYICYRTMGSIESESSLPLGRSESMSDTVSTIKGYCSILKPIVF